MQAKPNNFATLMDRNSPKRPFTRRPNSQSRRPAPLQLRQPGLGLRRRRMLDVSSQTVRSAAAGEVKRRDKEIPPLGWLTKRGRN